MHGDPGVRGPPGRAALPVEGIVRPSGEPGSPGMYKYSTVYYYYYLVFIRVYVIVYLHYVTFILQLFTLCYFTFNELERFSRIKHTYPRVNQFYIFLYKVF